MKKILLIEEQGVICNEIVKILLSQGFCIDVAKDGVEGLNKVKSVAPDCIITAIHLEKISGLELIMNVREQRNDTPIIALCKKERFGHCDYEMPAKQLGANEVLIRPFYGRELISIMRRLHVAI